MLKHVMNLKKTVVLMSKGKVVKIISNLYTVLVNDCLIDARLRGKFKNTKQPLIVGDIVDVDLDKKWITNIYPRTNYLERPKVSNIDLCIIVTSLKEPSLSLTLLDKELIFLSFHKIPSMIVLTKYDLLNEEEKLKIKKIMDYYNKIGIPTLINTDIAKLKTLLKEKTIALMGNSGVGKSTLINKLGNLSIDTHKISHALGRGVHTTRHVEIYPINDFYLIDTPGFGCLNLDIKKKDLAKYFIEFNNYNCYFNDCTHIKEDNCGIKKHVGKDILESRYNNYIKIREELK